MIRDLVLPASRLARAGLACLSALFMTSPALAQDPAPQELVSHGKVDAAPVPGLAVDPGVFAPVPSVPSTASRYRGAEQRLATVGYRLAAANAHRCERAQMMTGLVLHDASGYARRDRERLRRLTGMTYGFAVRELALGGVGEQAGLARGDEILAVNGANLARFGGQFFKQRGSYDRTEAFVALLEQVLQRGPAVLAVRRGSARAEVVLNGAAGCGGQFVVLPERALNARSDGRYVAVSARMMEFARSDDELAFVVAHEMVHNDRQHARKLRSVSPLLAQFGIGSARVRRTEVEADRLAVDYVLAAGGDPLAAEGLLRRAAGFPLMSLSLTHPGTARRIALVRDAVAERQIVLVASRSTSLVPQAAISAAVGAIDTGILAEPVTLASAS